MLVLEQLKQKVKVKFTAKRPANEAFDPAIIIVIAEIVTELVEVIQECVENREQALKVFQSPSLLQRFVLKRKVRQHLGWFGARKYGSDLQQALLETGKEVTREDLNELVVE